MERDKELRVRLTEKQWNQLDEIKEDYGIISFADTIRLMIREKYDKIQEQKRAVDLSLQEKS
ncbi:hypothetical protein ES704_03589 [subsurface metagenome]|jgi:hypothetical protein